MRFNCRAVPRASRGFTATGKRISAPLSMRTITKPSSQTAERAMSAKVFMPLLNYQLFIFFRKFFSPRQLAQLESLRLAEFHLIFHFKHRLAAAVTDMNVNRAVFVAVNEKPESVLLKNRRHNCDEVKTVLVIPNLFCAPVFVERSKRC